MYLAWGKFFYKKSKNSIFMNFYKLKCYFETLVESGFNDPDPQSWFSVLIIRLDAELLFCYSFYVYTVFITWLFLLWNDAQPESDEVLDPDQLDLAVWLQRLTSPYIKKFSV